MVDAIRSRSHSLPPEPTTGTTHSTRPASPQGPGPSSADPSLPGRAPRRATEGDAPQRRNASLPPMGRQAQGNGLPPPAMDATAITHAARDAVLRQAAQTPLPASPTTARPSTPTPSTPTPSTPTTPTATPPTASTGHTPTTPTATPTLASTGQTPTTPTLRPPTASTGHTPTTPTATPTLASTGRTPTTPTTPTAPTTTTIPAAMPSLAGTGQSQREGRPALKLTIPGSNTTPTASQTPLATPPLATTGQTPSTPTGSVSLQSTGQTPTTPNSPAPLASTGQTPATPTGSVSAQSTGQTPTTPTSPPPLASTGQTPTTPTGSVSAQSTGHTPATPAGQPRPSVGEPPASPSSPTGSTASSLPAETSTGVTPAQLKAALAATAAQRSVTYYGGHAVALGVQGATVAIGAAAGASDKAIKTTAHALGGLAAALAKEAIGEQMKTYPSLGATISLPTDTTAQRQGPRVMAGLNDLWTAMGAAAAGAALGSVLEPAVKSFAQAHGASEPLASGLAMGANYAMQRLVINPTLDTVSDLTSTFMKSKLPGAKGDHKHNEHFDKATMLGGMAARAAINWGGTMVLGPAINAGALLADSGTAAKVGATNALAWAGLPGWISLKVYAADKIKAHMAPDGVQTPTPQAFAMTQTPQGARPTPEQLV